MPTPAEIRAKVCHCNVFGSLGSLCIGADKMRAGYYCELKHAEAIVSAAQAWKDAKQAEHAEAKAGYPNGGVRAARLQHETVKAETALLAALETPGAGTGDAKVR